MGSKWRRWPVIRNREDLERVLQDLGIRPRPSLISRLFRFMGPHANYKEVYVGNIKEGFSQVAGHEVFHAFLARLLMERYGLKNYSLESRMRITREYGPIAAVEEGLADIAGGLSAERKRPWAESLERLEGVRRYYLRAVKRALDYLREEQLQELRGVDPHDIFATLSLDIPIEEVAPRTWKNRLLSLIGLFPSREVRDLLNSRWWAMRGLEPLSGTWFSEEFMEALSESDLSSALTRLRKALENIPQHPWDFVEPPEVSGFFKRWESKLRDEKV